MQNMPKHDREIVTAIIANALLLGYAVGCSDTGLKPVTDGNQIFANVGECDEERLIFRKPGAEKAAGVAFIVYGNGAGETVSDYSDNAEMRQILAVAYALGDVQEAESYASDYRRVSSLHGLDVPGPLATLATVREAINGGYSYRLTHEGVDELSGGALNLTRAQMVAWVAAHRQPLFDENKGEPRPAADVVAAVMAEVANVPDKVEKLATV